MSKRPASGDATPAPKQPRLDNGSTPATSARPHGRVVLDVGGTRVVSSKTTLEGSSSYFQSMLARWDESDEPVFIDADGDAFQVLLSYMRSRTLVLPEQDTGLCVRVLLLAEYLGMDALLEEVKTTAYANLHPGAAADDERPASVAFDETVGTLQEAIKAKVLPERFFAKAERTVKKLIPAPAGTTAVFGENSASIYQGQLRIPSGALGRRLVTTQPGVRTKLDVLNYALVELPDGREVMDAVVQTQSSYPVSASAATGNKGHTMFASDYCKALKNCEHYLIMLPAQAAAQMHAIPKGTVTGIWVKPAITVEDIGKHITINGNTITVGGQQRKVEWDNSGIFGGDGNAPEGVDNVLINNVDDESHFLVDTEDEFRPRPVGMPYLSGEHNRMKVEPSFARTAADFRGGSAVTDFLMPNVNADEQSILQDCKNVTFGDMRFHKFE